VRVTTVVIGAGHAGLAMSHCLTARSIDHVILERGEVANSWKTERWDSLRLLTPNWMSRLPGYQYEGDDPDGFLTMPETIAFIERYAGAISAPVRTRTRVTSATRVDDGYLVATDDGEWRCRSLVVATGACNVPALPPVAEALPPGIQALTSREYRNPGRLEPGGVLVVGASASGTQIAEEIQHSGRPVTLAVGEHIRSPRVYRGRDIKWWMDAAGVLDDRYDEVDDIGRARNVPSLQLAGSKDRRTVDLNRLTGLGVRLVGRLAGIADGNAQFSGSLRNQCELSDLKMNRLLERIDAWATEHGSTGRWILRSASSPRASTLPRRSESTFAAARSERWYGPPASTPTIRGCRHRCSTARAASAMTAASSNHPGCTCWASRSCGGGDRVSSTERRAMRATSPITSRATWTIARWARAPETPGRRRRGSGAPRLHPARVRTWTPRARGPMADPPSGRVRAERAASRPATSSCSPPSAAIAIPFTTTTPSRAPLASAGSWSRAASPARS
jgi:putative flavoprotein involved in K+ transport